tara:strand:- start:1331 stop:1558 length:228 start_codon:yes stop_codon:yes gene_type:complete
MISMDDVIKEDLNKVTKMSVDDIMEVLQLDGEDSAVAVQQACRAYVRSDLGRRQKNKQEVSSRQSARVSRGGPAW